MRCVRLAIKTISNVRTVDGESLQEFQYDNIAKQNIPMPLIFTIEQGGKCYGIDMKLQLEDEEMRPVCLDAPAEGVSRDDVEIVIKTRVVYAGTDEEVPDMVKLLPHSNRKLLSDGSATISARLMGLSSKGVHRGRCFQLVMYPEINEAAVTYLNKHVACDFFGEVLSHPIRVMSKCVYVPKSRHRAQNIDKSLPVYNVATVPSSDVPLPGLSQLQQMIDTSAGVHMPAPLLLSSRATEDIAANQDSQHTDAAADVCTSESCTSDVSSSVDSDTDEDEIAALMYQFEMLQSELHHLEEEHATALERLQLETLRHEALTHNLTYLRASLPYFLKQYGIPARQSRSHDT